MDAAATTAASGSRRLSRVACRMAGDEHVELLAFGQGDTEPTRGIAVPAVIAYPLIRLVRRAQARAESGLPSRYYVAVTPTRLLVSARRSLGGLGKPSLEVRRSEIAGARRLNVGGMTWHRVEISLSNRPARIDLGIWGSKADQLCALLGPHDR